MIRTIKIKAANLNDVTPWTKGDASVSRANYINLKLAEYRKEIKPGKTIKISGSAFGGELCLINLGIFCTTREGQAPVWACIMIDLDGNVSVKNNYRNSQEWGFVK